MRTVKLLLGVRMMSTQAVKLDQLKNQHLVRNLGFINGQFTAGKAKSTFQVKNPANGDVLAEVPRMGAQDVEDASKIAFTAWQSWKETTANERSKFLVRISELMQHYKDDLATILTLEAGKPLAEAKGELQYAISFLDFYAEECKRVHGEILQTPSRNKRIMSIKQPVGPVGLITPWNFPAAMITRKLAPALGMYASAHCWCPRPSPSLITKPLSPYKLQNRCGMHSSDQAPERYSIVCTSDMRNHRRSRSSPRRRELSHGGT